MYPFYQIALGSITYLISYYTQKFEQIDKNEFLKDRVEDQLKSRITREFDYIVVGAGSAGHIGQNGLVFISQKGTVLDEVELHWLDIWKRAGTELGYKTFENSNSPQIEGFGNIVNNKLFGRRYSANSAFIKPIIGRETLTISKYSEVKQIDFDDENRAIGVKFLKHGVWQYARAKNEIIISAGTLNSPLILMRSGIGPEDQLTAAGIPVRVNSPVGKFFQDHPQVSVDYAYPEILPYQNVSEKYFEDFLQRGTGPLASIIGTYGQAFIQTNAFKKDLQSRNKGDRNWPDLQIIVHSNLNVFNGTGELQFLLSLGHAKSVGSLKLNTTDPWNGQVILDPNYLADPQDLEVLLEGYELVEKLLETSAYSELNLRLDTNPKEFCKQFKFKTREYRECVIRYTAGPHWHFIGTARMGSDNDPDAVVDTQLRVKGVKNLRVVDNSIQPFITNANTQGPVWMIAQKACDMILEDNKNL